MQCSEWRVFEVWDKSINFDKIFWFVSSSFRQPLGGKKKKERTSSPGNNLYLISKFLECYTFISCFFFFTFNFGVLFSFALTSSRSHKNGTSNVCLDSSPRAPTASTFPFALSFSTFTHVFFWTQKWDSENERPFYSQIISEPKNRIISLFHPHAMIKNEVTLLKYYPFSSWSIVKFCQLSLQCPMQLAVFQFFRLNNSPFVSI